MSFDGYRIILHIDGDAFYASVEETINPKYKKVPMAICGNPKSRRGIILSKNQLASKYNVKTAETVWQARQKCPNLELAPARHDLYDEFCEKLNDIYFQYTDQVERLSIDESFLDVTGSMYLFDVNAYELAKEIQTRVVNELGITVSIGVSFNKIFAKMASDYKKPNGITVITPQNYKNIVWEMPVDKLYSVGKATAANLRSLQIYTIKDLANADLQMLARVLGKSGEKLHTYANGADDSQVIKADQGEDIKSVGNGRTFKRNLTSIDDIKVAVTALSDTVASRLRRKNLKCTTVQVMIKDPKFKVISRQTTVKPTWLAADISKHSLEIIQSSWKVNSPIRMLTITGAGIVQANQEIKQLSLFDDYVENEKHIKQEKLEKTMDKIRNKYGKDSISHASIVQNDLGLNDKRNIEDYDMDEEDE